MHTSRISLTNFHPTALPTFNNPSPSKLFLAPIRKKIAPSLIRTKKITTPYAKNNNYSNNQPLSEADLYISVDSSSSSSLPLSPFQNTPWYISIPLGFFSLIAILRIIKAIRRRNRINAQTSLEDRGFKRRGAADQDHYSKLMRGMRTVQYEELSDEQVQAARMRRRQEIERDAAPMDFDSIQLPENHPFAVKVEVSAEEEELQRSRLSAKRGLSPEDMRLLKQQQALAAQMEEEEEEEENRRRSRRQN